jgi:hypothetical protein
MNREQPKRPTPTEQLEARARAAGIDPPEQIWTWGVVEFAEALVNAKRRHLRLVR